MITKFYSFQRIIFSPKINCGGKIIASTQGHPKLKNQKNLLTYVYFLSFISLGLVSGVMGPSIPSFAHNTNATLNEVSSLFIFSSMGYITGSFLAGFLFQKFAGNKVLMVVIVLMAIGIALLPVVQSLWMLVAMVFLISIAQSNLDVGDNTLLVWLHGSKVAPYMNGMHFFFGLGTFIAPLIIAQSLRGTQTINIAFWVIAILIVLPVPFLWRLESPENPDSESFKKRNEHLLRPKAEKKVVSLLVIFFLFFAGAEITFSNWIYTHGLINGFTTVETSAYLTSVFWGAFMLGRFLSIGLSRYLTNKQIIWIDLVGCLFSMLLIMIFSHSAVILWVGTALFGFFIATGFPTGINLAEELNAVSARITSTFFVASSISAMISPWIVGQFIESINTQILIQVVAINIVFATLAMTGIQLLHRKAT
ncbi:MAG TPA: MFS transporter [Anaerolineaceae bacterium]|nr:MFS transporter [Anaerolineaceae bacterium]